MMSTSYAGFVGAPDVNRPANGPRRGMYQNRATLGHPYPCHIDAAPLRAALVWQLPEVRSGFYVCF